MIDRDAELPLKRQAQLLGISRGTVYYRPEPVSPAQLALMRRIDELHLEHPFAGSRMLRGSWRDNVLVERLWRSVKYEDVYLKAYDGVSAARQNLAAYLELYNARRPNQSHAGRTPDRVYFATLTALKEAA